MSKKEISLDLLNGGNTCEIGSESSGRRNAKPNNVKPLAGLMIKNDYVINICLQR